MDIKTARLIIAADKANSGIEGEWNHSDPGLDAAIASFHSDGYEAAVADAQGIVASDDADEARWLEMDMSCQYCGAPNGH